MYLFYGYCAYCDDLVDFVYEIHHGAVCINHDAHLITESED